jgi:hypothetical protein
MTAFHTIAVPHDDILAGRLTMDVFAADLWEVYRGRGPEEYRNPAQFFQKTYQTEGLTHLLDVVHQRLQGRGGDSVLQIQTPFGGGKTHALIAMYHRAAEWGTKCVVIVGTPMASGDTLWGMLEEQLTGQKRSFTGMVAPGREAIRELLAHHQPVLILMDEVLEYVTKAAGVPVGESTLAAQSIAYMQELTEAVTTLERVSLVVTLPASLIEHYDEQAERLFQQIQRVAGRVEKIYTPVQEHEITSVIRRRLFASVDGQRAARIVDDFVEYAGRENILPPGTEPSEYRKRFEAAYPFLPEVVDTLYERWGSLPTFQRTRGVLRLLALVIYALRDQSSPYITLADFNLADQEIRRELLKHIGNEYDSVLGSDITTSDAGARRVNGELGKAYQGLRLGTRAATTIFLYSFSGGIERGANLGEIKRNATTLENPSNAVTEAVELLRERLFYLQERGGRYFFTSQPNLNRILLTRMENITQQQLQEAERDLLKLQLFGRRLKVFIWPENTADIPDTPELKLLILPHADDGQMRAMLAQKAATPRIERNTLFFLAPIASERAAFENLQRRVLGYQALRADATLKLPKEQSDEVAANLKKAQSDLVESLRRAYRRLFVPAREGLREIDLGIPTYGESNPLNDDVYQKLRMEREILESIPPIIIKQRYLQDHDWIFTEQLYLAGYRTPGEPRATGRDVWEAGIAEGVANGLFGLGELEGEQPKCRYFKQQPTVGLAGNEVLIKADICLSQREAQQAQSGAEMYPVGGAGSSNGGTHDGPANGPTPDIPGLPPVPDGQSPRSSVRASLRLSFMVPKGRVSSLMGVMNLLQSKFGRMDVTLSVTDGQLSEQDYEDKVREAFRQMGVEVREDS